MKYKTGLKGRFFDGKSVGLLGNQNQEITQIKNFKNKENGNNGNRKWNKNRKI